MMSVRELLSRAPLGQLGLPSEQEAGWHCAWDSRYRSFWDQLRHGDMDRWLQALDGLPDVEPDELRFNDSTVGIVSNEQLAAADSLALEQGLRELMPWRKGPFNVLGTAIDTEWRSDWKWDRIVAALDPLEDRTVLDVGCGSGYHMWRMLGAGAGLVLGVEPHVLFNLQFHAINSYASRSHIQPIAMMPLSLEELPPSPAAFDTIFSLGVVYHRKSPIEHLQDLRRRLRRGGQIVVESLVLNDWNGSCLLPEDRYARMRNVWFIPSLDLFEQMLARSGFEEIKQIDVTETTVNEQRQTEWMSYESLAECLDPEDSSRTVEGYPAPVRAAYSARRIDG